MTSSGNVRVELELTNRAMSDLAEIHAFAVEHCGQATAHAYLDDVNAALARLRQYPDLLRSEPQFATHLRFYSAGRHYLVCDRIDDTIFVLAVVHASRDLPQRLADCEPTLLAEAEILHKQLRDKHSAK